MNIFIGFGEFFDVLFKIFWVVLPLTLFDVYKKRGFGNGCKLVDFLISLLQLGKLIWVIESLNPAESSKKKIILPHLSSVLQCCLFFWRELLLQDIV